MCCGIHGTCPPWRSIALQKCMAWRPQERAPYTAAPWGHGTHWCFLVSLRWCRVALQERVQTLASSLTWLRGLSSLFLELVPWLSGDGLWMEWCVLTLSRAECQLFAQQQSPCRIFTCLAGSPGPGRKWKRRTGGEAQRCGKVEPEAEASASYGICNLGNRNERDGEVIGTGSGWCGNPTVSRKKEERIIKRKWKAREKLEQ